MRQLSIHRPTAKARNPERHFRSLQKWANSFEGFYPKNCGEQFWHEKVPVLDRLLNPPRAQPEWQSRGLKLLCTAARHMAEAKPDAAFGKSWVAVLSSYPWMYYSEVIVFFDRAYYESFLRHSDPILDRRLSENLGVSIPSGMIESGGIVSWPIDDDDETLGEHSEEWWVIGEPIA